MRGLPGTPSLSACGDCLHPDRACCVLLECLTSIPPVIVTAREDIQRTTRQPYREPRHHGHTYRSFRHRKDLAASRAGLLGASAHDRARTICQRCPTPPAPDWMPGKSTTPRNPVRITSYNVCYTKLLRLAGFFFGEHLTRKTFFSYGNGFA